MFRYVLLTVLRVAIIYAVVYAVYRLLRTVFRSFWEGVKEDSSGRVEGTSGKRVEYRVVQDTTFEEVKEERDPAGVESKSKP